MIWNFSNIILTILSVVVIPTVRSVYMMYNESDKLKEAVSDMKERVKKLEDDNSRKGVDIAVMTERMDNLETALKEFREEMRQSQRDILNAISTIKSKA